MHKAKSCTRRMPLICVGPLMWRHPVSPQVPQPASCIRACFCTVKSPRQTDKGARASNQCKTPDITDAPPVPPQANRAESHVNTVDFAFFSFSLCFCCSPAPLPRRASPSTIPMHLDSRRCVKARTCSVMAAVQHPSFGRGGIT